MGLYMTQFAYTAEAWAALAKQPENRREAFQSLVQRHGGRFHELYYCFGDWDGVTIFEAPDDTAAAAIVLSAVSPGHLKAVHTTSLLTMDQTLNALRKAGGQIYRGPS
jgi:uncharacterized protein with GYD domain